MKNKKLTYLLIVIVAGLWGLIIYSVLGAVSADDDTSAQAPISIVKEAYNDFSVPKDTAKLLLNYRDPFGIVKQKDTTSIKAVKSLAHPVVPAVTKPAMNWSFITYSGYIRNPSTKKLITLVNINGQNTTLSEGESKSQVKLLKNLRDSIKVSYAGKTKFISIKSSQ
ncbi:MAG: hypothetical protein JST50_06975 [Bacteroidetes bacterium]|jgi:hypothetical protein|nr:hypothetical protein [Bacteroidota bacterium]